MVTQAGEKLELISEKNYIFKLTDEVKDKIIKWLSNTEEPTVYLCI